MADESRRWSAQRAWAWYDALPWLCGHNFLPSTAVNFTQMWQAATFDPATIDRELAWAQELGFNTLRSNLNIAAWREDAPGLVHRMDTFLALAARRGHRVMFCHFDDCAFSGLQPYGGPQRPPVPGMHNSGCVPSPGHEIVLNPSRWPEARDFLTQTLGPFARDPRVLAWDLYNEPGNGVTGGTRLGAMSLPLLRAAFEWARAIAPDQPLTSGVWIGEDHDLNEAMVTMSDVVSFHAYAEARATGRAIEEHARLGRPVLCTEWMARTCGSRFETHLPLFKAARVGCWCWGLVNGRTQTHLPWGWSLARGEPPEWHHDVMDADGRPYRASEAAAIRAATGRSM